MFFCHSLRQVFKESKFFNGPAFAPLEALSALPYPAFNFDNTGNPSVSWLWFAIQRRVQEVFKGATSLCEGINAETDLQKWSARGFEGKGSAMYNIGNIH